MKFIFPGHLSVNNKDFNSEINTDRDEYTVSRKQIAAFNDVFDDSMTVEYSDWRDKSAVHCILLEMAVDKTKVANSSIRYEDTPQGRMLSAKQLKEMRIKAKVDAKKNASKPPHIFPVEHLSLLYYEFYKMLVIHPLT